MAATLKWNTLGSASHRNQSEHIVGPLREGAREKTVALDVSARCEIVWAAREPLILAVLKRSLDQRALRVTATLEPDGASEPLAPMSFAPYTELGAAVVCHLPAVDSQTRKAGPMVIGFAAIEASADGAESAIPVEGVSDWLEVSVVEGVLGRLSYMLGAEHMRIRRTMREILAMRSLDTARDDALDRLGAAVAVPRFTDRIDYDAGRGEIVTRSEDTNGQPIVESDDAYRRRLRLYCPLLVPSGSHIRARLNGNTGTGATGLLSGVGVAGAIELLETDSPFSVAIHCLAVGGDEIRTNFLAHLRDHYLLAPAQALEQDRYLSEKERDRQAALRASVQLGFDFQSGQFVAPMLASALGRAARCRRALLAAPVPQGVLRAQQDAGGSRYELGLGVDVEPLSQADVEALRGSVLDPQRASVDDIEVEGLLQKMAASGVPEIADDPLGAWFFAACGLRTVHRVAADRVYLSHLSTSGLAIDGVSALGANSATELSAQFHASGDPGPNSMLTTALGDADRTWTEGHAAWTRVSDHADSWDQAEVNAAASMVFQAAGLPSLDATAEMSERLKRVSPELLAVIRLDSALAAQITAGDAAAVGPLAELKRVLGGAGLVSALPLVSTGGEVTLTVSVIGLPSVGSNLAPRRAVGYRWYVVPIQGDGGSVGAIGSRTTYTSAGAPSLNAIVTVGYSRHPDRTDPYEFQVRLPEGTLLDVEQYEYLMNALMHMHPIGVEINTWRLRQEHVDLDRDGSANPLGPALARTYRHFRRPRHRGELGVGLNET